MKNKKINILCLLLLTGLSFLQAQPVQEHGNLSVQGTRIVDQHGETVTLRGVSYGWHNWWPRFYNNEPVRDSWEVIKSYSIDVIKAIREADPDNIILVGSPHWDQDVHIVADDPITGYNNIMYTLHFYAATHGQSLRDRGNYALEKGIPLFVSECAGMSANGDGPINYEAWQTWIDWMQKNDISMVFWSIADKNETCSMLTKSASSEGNWSESDLKESGIKTCELLRSYAEKK